MKLSFDTIFRAVNDHAGVIITGLTIAVGVLAIAVRHPRTPIAAAAQASTTQPTSAPAAAPAAQHPSAPPKVGDPAISIVEPTQREVVTCKYAAGVDAGGLALECSTTWCVGGADGGSCPVSPRFIQYIAQQVQDRVKCEDALKAHGIAP